MMHPSSCSSTRGLVAGWACSSLVCSRVPSAAHRWVGRGYAGRPAWQQGHSWPGSRGLARVRGSLGAQPPHHRCNDAWACWRSRCRCMICQSTGRTRCWVRSGPTCCSRSSRATRARHWCGPGCASWPAAATARWRGSSRSSSSWACSHTRQWQSCRSAQVSSRGSSCVSHSW